MARVLSRSGLQGSHKGRRRAGVVGAAFLVALVAAIILRQAPASEQRPGQPQVLLVARVTEEQHTTASVADEAASAAAAEEQQEQQQPAEQQEQGQQAAEQQEQGQQAAEQQQAGAAEQAGSAEGQSVHTGIFFTVKGPDDKEEQMEVLNEPVPKDCHMEQNADYDGAGLTWGLEWKKASAVQCCQACKDFKPNEHGERCDVWVWCGSPTGECWAPDFWNHTTGECWLKSQKEWDNSVDLAAINLKVNLRGPYAKDFREYHTDSPEVVPWTAGLIPK